MKYDTSVLFELQNASRSQRDNVFAQASLSKAVWALAVKIMDAFEAGELKDQRLSKKQLTAKPEFKQQNLQPVQSLPPAFLFFFFHIKTDQEGKEWYSRPQ